MILDAIRNFPSQFAWEPKVQREEKLARKGKFVVVGMGGSHLAADVLVKGSPYTDMKVHSDYGLPTLSDAALRETLVIAVSYSGNTEETMDALDEAIRRGVACAAVATGGKLLDRARARGVPFVELPQAGIQPRMALGFMLRALMKLIGDEKGLRDSAQLASALDPSALEPKGKALAKTLEGKVPMVYTSFANRAIAYTWKVKFNEGAKIPAFWNAFPELNHNEMTGFDVMERTKPLSEKASFVFLKDSADHPRIARRMEVARGMLEKRGFPVEMLSLSGGSVWEKAFSSLLLADWTAYFLAETYGTDPEKVPMVEEFKKML